MIRVRKRIEQYNIDDAKESRVCADADRQCDDGYEREAGFLHQHADAVTEVLSQFFEPSPSPHLACHLFDQPDVAEFTPRRRLSFINLLAALHPVALRHFEMGLDLFFQFFVPPLTAPKWESHVLSSLSLTTGVISRNRIAVIHDAMPPSDRFWSPCARACNRRAAPRSSKISPLRRRSPDRSLSHQTVGSQ